MSKTIATTKMSSRGQIVIPESIRKQLGLVPGAQFGVEGYLRISIGLPPDELEVGLARIKAELDVVRRVG